MTQSRRDFIRTVILSSGAVFADWKDVLGASAWAHKKVAMTTASQHFAKAHQFLKEGKSFPRTTSKVLDVDYIVIGGGAAGLAAAWQLKKTGKDFLLLENEPFIGGVAMNMNAVWKGMRYPLGSTYFYRYNGVYRELYDDIGVHPLETGEDALYLGKEGTFVDWWNPQVISTLPFPAADREAFRKFREVLLAMSAPMYPISGTSKDVLKEYDSLSALGFVERFGSPVLADTMDLYARSVLGAPLSDVNAYAFLNFYSVEFGDSFQIPCYTFPGGLREIATATERYLGAEHIRVNALVVSVTQDKGGVDTQYIDTRTGELKVIHSKTAIVATPKNIARRFVRDLPTEQANAMASLRYAPYITIALCCTAPLFEKRAFDFWVSDNARRFTDIIDVTAPQDTASGKLGRKGEFVYMLSSPRPADEFKRIDPASLDAHLATFAQKTAEAVAEHIPGAREKIVEMHVYAWGHSLVVPTVGSYSVLAPKIAAPHGNIYFAHSDNDIAPGWENAVWWGAETAKRVL